MKYLLAGSLGAAMLLAVSTGAQAETLPGAGIKVVPNHTASVELFQTDLVALGLKDLGYDVDPSQELAVQPSMLGVAQGDLTMRPSFWVPEHNQFFEQAGGKDKLEVVGDFIDDCVQGYLIDKKTADELGIKSITQLKDPEVAKKFDFDGDGKADLYGCEPGWACEKVIDHHLQSYGLADTVTQKQGNYTALMADAVERIKAGKPTIYFTWMPNWTSAVLQPGRDVTWLTVPFTAMLDNSKPNTELKGVGNLGFAVNVQKILANKDFVEANPVAKKWFELVNVPVADVAAENLAIHNGEDSDADIMNHAQAWKDAHKAKWDAWISEAKAAAK